MLKELKIRSLSPVFIASMFAVVAIIVNAAGIKFEEITSWGILLEDILMILKNPFLIGSIIVAVFGFLNNPTDKKKF